MWGPPQQGFMGDLRAEVSGGWRDRGPSGSGILRPMPAQLTWRTYEPLEKFILLITICDLSQSLSL